MARIIGLLVVFCLCGVLPVQATILYVSPASSCPTSGACANACTAEGTACRTLGQALSKLTSGSGHEVRVDSSQGINWVLDQGVTVAPGISTARNRIRGWNFATDAPAPATLSRHRLLGAGAWAVHSGKVYRASHPVHPHREIVVDYLLQNTTAHGHDACTYDVNDINTYNIDACHQPMRKVLRDIVNCPEDLDRDGEACFDDPTDRVYLYSDDGDAETDDNPGVRFTSPGVTVRHNVLATEGVQSPMVVLDHDHWTLEGIHLYGIGGAGIFIRASNITMTDVTLSFNKHSSTAVPDVSGGSAAIQIHTTTGQTRSNIEITRLECHDIGRDCLDLTGPGTIGVVRVTDWLCWNSNNHPCFNPLHNEGGVGPRGTIILAGTFHVHNACTGASAGTGGTANITVQRFVFHHGFTDENDPRIQVCGLDTLAGWLQDWGGTTTFGPRSIITGTAYGLRNKHGAGKIVCDHCTITGNSRVGAMTTVDNTNTTLTFTRSYIGGNGTSGTTSGQNAQVALWGPSNQFLGGNTANDENYYWKPGDSAGTGQTHRIGGVNKTTADWKDEPGIADDAAVQLSGDPLTQGPHAAEPGHDFMPKSPGALIACSTVGSFTGGGAECGALESLIIPGDSRTTVDPDTWTFNVESLWAPLQVDASCAGIYPKRAAPTCVPGSAGSKEHCCTASNCAVSGAAVTFDVGGPACTGLGAGDTLRLEVAEGALWAMAFPGVRAYNHGLADVSVENLLGGSAPTPIAPCRIVEGDPNGVRVDFTPNAPGNMTPDAPTGFSRCTNSTCTSLVAQTSAARTGAATYVVQFPTDAAPSTEHWLKYVPGTLANAAAVPAAGFTLGPCRNELFVPDPDTWHVAPPPLGAPPPGRTCAQAKNPGTPVSTIAAGLGCLERGGVLSIGPGTYPERIGKQILFDKRGLNASNPTLIKAATRKTAILRPPAIPDSAPENVERPIINVNEANTTDIIFDGLVLDGALVVFGKGNGRFMVANSSDAAGVARITFQHGIVRNVPEVSVSVGNVATHISFLNSEVRDTRLQNPGERCHTDAGAGCHGFYWQGQNGRIENNLIENVSGHGIQVYNSSSHPINNTIVRGNRWRNIDKSGILAGGSARNLLIANNFVSDAGNGIAITGDGSLTKVYHNTVVGMRNSPTGQCIRRTPESDAQGNPLPFSAQQANLIRNNIFSGCFGNRAITPTGNLCTNTEATNCGAQTTLPALQFTNVAAGDFHLLMGSSARPGVACRLADVPQDIDGAARPPTGNCDYGADEFGETDVTAPQIVAGSLFPPVPPAPASARPAGTTSQLVSWATSEPATCRTHATSVDYDSMVAGSVTTTGGTSHSFTRAGLTNGQLVTGFLACEDPSGNESAIVPYSFTVAFPRPTLDAGACTIANDAPSTVSCLINDGGNGPIQPATNCTGFTATKGAIGSPSPPPWTVTSCNRAGTESRVLLTMATPAAHNDQAKITYTEGTPQRILNAGGTLELQATTVTATNGVLAPAPVIPENGCVVQSTAPDKVLVTFNPGVSGQMTPASDCTGLTATLNGSAWTQEPGGCDPIGETQFLLDHASAADHDDEIFVLFTQGTPNTIRNSAGTEAQALPSPGRVCQNNIPPDAPNPVTLQSAFILPDAPAIVRFNIDTGGSSPVLPASGATGFSCTLNGDAWTPVGTGTRDGTTDRLLHTFTPAVTSASDVVVCAYTPGNVTNNAGTASLTAFADVAVDNQVEDPVPAPEMTGCALTEGDGPRLIRVAIDSKNLSPLTPATDCTGFSAVRVAAVSWEVTDCTLVPAADQLLLTMAEDAGANQRVDLTFTQGTANTVLNSGGAELRSQTLECSNTLTPPPPPTYSSSFVNDEGPMTVFVLINSDSTPLLPASGCVGFFVTKDLQQGLGPVPWPISSCARPDPSVMALTMSTTLEHFAVARLGYVQQGSGEPNRVRSQDEIELAAFAAEVIKNDVRPPVVTGTVTQTHARTRLAGVPGSGFAAHETIRECLLNGACPVPQHSVVQLHAEVQCSGSVCANTAYRWQACATPGCDPTNPADAGWTALADCTMTSPPGVCLSLDATVANLGPTSNALTGYLSSCPRGGGVYLKRDAGGDLPPVTLDANQCARYTVVIRNTHAVGERTCLRLVKSDGTVLDGYPTHGGNCVDTVAPYAIR